jgi:hypothetical protein
MTDDRFLDRFDRDGALAEAAHRAAAPTRRGLLRGGAGAAALGIFGHSAVAAASGSRKSDFAILNYALGLEYLQASFYSEAERLGALHGELARQAHVVGAHERAHVQAFRHVLGAAAIKRPTFDFRGVTENPDAFRRTAVAFEDLAVAAYKDRAPHLQSRVFLQTALDVHSVEARHAAWIRRLAGVLPAAAAFDEPLAPHRVDALVRSTRFIVARPHMTARRKPKFTG